MDSSDISEGAKGVFGTIASVAADEGKKLIKTIPGQITGKGVPEATTEISSGENQNSQTANDIAAMDKKDQQFREAGQAEIRAKINSIYAEYAAKRKKETADKTQQEKTAEMEEERLEEIEKQEIAQNPDPAIAKTRAEVGRNFGAE